MCQQAAPFGEILCRMLCAYYDKTCDSSKFFDDLEIAANDVKNYQKYRNPFDVIYLDITNVMGEAGDEELPSFIRRNVTEELSGAYPALKTDESFSTTLINAAVYMTGILPVKKDGMIEDA